MSESQDRPRRARITRGNVPQRGRGKPAAQPPAAAPAPGRHTPPPPVQDDDALTLPAGAIVALRKSGGLIFRSREIVVYGDGRVETSAAGGGRPTGRGTGRTLSGTELTALRRALGGIDFDQLPATTGQQRPDAFVYEIAALVEGVPRVVEVAEGRVPATVAPLIRQLDGLAVEK